MKLLIDENSLPQATGGIMIYNVSRFRSRPIQKSDTLLTV